ncbi:hypothetical protein CLAFUW4_07646 [Fulvia fulva]|uniref:Uncharacterized protein n=1 Tax=Passalora fulva TaxID=5499 RepID=A0A9Q8LD36_PASFU|nr:uncharacterized protein CLAFUR5_07774 [Fulvia fulva]KAK4629736.1 hypothetical protein CLAFUR4_07651 [Fulvia fulva]KAK4630412.1 hypothetical protein CLAFUR0_07651 [Fulvia fulva]UJO15275.1 hypothetical protein CLAFUR5_07774 [Fulvia fulva]WPV12895.1 hypothetical protein CLAFUW4_07646 [Fulvia fulva]WPV27430.1 hypothetical protein CLAFUW7_07647 [Fulvia fulva]
MRLLNISREHEFRFKMNAYAIDRAKNPADRVAQAQASAFMAAADLVCGRPGIREKEWQTIEERHYSSECLVGSGKDASVRAWPTRGCAA